MSLRNLFTNLSEMTRTEEFRDYIDDRTDVQHLFINDPERGTRCADAAEEGCDGSTYAEHIDDQRQYLKDCVKIYDPDIDLDIDDDTYDITMTTYDKVMAELDELEAMFIKEGTIDQSGV